MTKQETKDVVKESLLRTAGLVLQFTTGEEECVPQDLVDMLCSVDDIRACELTVAAFLTGYFAKDAA
jgi:hypothetical protein